MANETGIWLQVIQARFEGDGGKTCQVILQGDRGYPEPVWWPVESDALATNQTGFDAYKRIADELDKKRIVSAKLGPRGKDEAKTAANTVDNTLRCIALRFQSSEVVNR